MTSLPLACRPAPPASPAAAGWAARVVDTLIGWRERARSRRRLALLDEHLIRDIGVDRAAISGEIDKPFWRP